MTECAETKHRSQVSLSFMRQHVKKKCFPESQVSQHQTFTALSSKIFAAHRVPVVCSRNNELWYMVFFPPPHPAPLPQK